MGNQLTNNQENKKRLPILLEEFREALEAEIDAIKKKSSSSAIPLANGKRIAENASQFQYVFTIDSILDTPDGSPAELIIHGKQGIEAIIVSVEELRITLSVGEDLGDFIPYAKLQSDLSILLKRLIDRIENNSEVKNSVGLRMLGQVAVEGKPEQIAYSSETKLNSSQKSAVESSIGRNMTFIWGPPGTGKTTTIGTIIRELYSRNHAVLLVSHTNTAVDQAIIKAAENSTKSDLENGCILRLGVAKNPELGERFPQITIEYQRAIRGKELNVQLEEKTEQLNILNIDIDKLNKQLIYYNWYIDYQTKKEDLTEAISQYQEAADKNKLLKIRIGDLELEQNKMVPNTKLAKEYLELREIYNEQIHTLDSVNSEAKDAKKQIEKLNGDINMFKSQLEQYNRRSEIEKELSKNISCSSLQQILKKAENSINEIQKTIIKENTELTTLQERFSETSQSSAIRRLLKGLPKPEILSEEINVHKNTLKTLNEELNIKTVEYGKTQALYKKISDLEEELNRLSNGNRKQIEIQYNKTIKEIEDLKEKIRVAPEKVNALSIKITEIQMSMHMLRDCLSNDPEDIVYEFEELENRIASIKQKQDLVRRKIRLIKQEIDKSINSIKIISAQIELHIDFDNYQNTISALDSFYDSFSNEYANFNLNETQENINFLKESTKKLITEINEIKARLGEIDKQIIEQARIVGTTLTKAYLSDELQARKFDTVILDEASMASIPALWATTLMSNNNVIIVGDFKQLPPIVLSSDEVAKKWIGRDIFEASGVKAMFDKNQHPDYFIILNQQHRMEPAIADIANRYYGGLLESPNSSKREEDKREFYNWYANCFGTDSPVTLVDTEGLNAWVTSVTKGSQSSRLNFLSAALSVNLAERILSKYSYEGDKPKESKVLIISPYRPHTKLIDLLLKDSEINDDIIRAGTVHSFQGSEADVVIFDLVVDEPHFRVNLFMTTAEIMEQMRRLFNVSVTRAKFKLIIVGDFNYCLSKGRNSELGNLLRYLISDKGFPRIDARDLAPKLHEKAIRAQQMVVGGEVELSHERLIVTQEAFYKYLSQDFMNAKSEIIIYSPFITENRLANLLPQIQAAINRNVAIYVITKSQQERNNSEMAHYRKMEEHLSKIGVTVIHKKGMHEKLIFIDGEIVWNGSLNPLSFSSTQEIMERRQNKEVQSNFKEVLRISELIECINSIESKCPICNSEMIAAEGSEEPYYWRCVNDNCFTRGIDQKYPMNGELTCANCGSAVEFGYWGEEPSWRCTANKRHHQKLYRSHLKLPKMEKKIAKKEMKKVLKYLDETYPEKSTAKRQKTISTNSVQLSMFD